jgi:hypothetical protein
MTLRRPFRLSRAVGGLLFLMVAAAGAVGVTASSAPASQARTRMWHGMRIQPLDPPPARVAGVRALTAAAGGGSSSTSTAPSTSSSSATPTPKDVVLSNERTFSQWAYVNDTQPIYRQPTTASARIARLHWDTEDGFPEVYLLLKAHWDAQGREWVRVRIPMRPNGRTGWVRRDALGGFHLTHLLVVVNRERLRIYLYSRGRLVWRAPVGVGKRSTPTPAGHFWIRERFKIDDRRSGYWPYAFGTAAYSSLSDWPGGGVVGIHGPYYQPQLIPGRISHGCIRLHVSDDAWLARHLPLGTPLRIA